MLLNVSIKFSVFNIKSKKNSRFFRIVKKLKVYDKNKKLGNLCFLIIICISRYF